MAVTYGYKWETRRPQTPVIWLIWHPTENRRTGDRRGLVTLVTYTQLMGTWRILSFFLVTVLALLWFIPSCSACRSVHLKLYAKIVVILLLFATWGRIALALWCDEKVRGYSLKYVSGLGWEEAPEHFFRRTAITSPDCQEFIVWRIFSVVTIFMSPLMDEFTL